MNIVEGIHSFYFDNDQIINNQVQAVTTIELYFLVNQRQWYLSGDFSASFAQLVGLASLVSRFKQARSKCTMHFNGRTDDVLGNVIQSF